MKIRSITVGLDPGFPLDTARIARAGRFVTRAKQACEENGLEVQTTRLATPPFPRFLAGQSHRAVIRFAQELEACCLSHGLDYCALGPVDPRVPEERRFLQLLPDLIAATENVFVSAVLGNGGQAPSAASAHDIAQTMVRIARVTPDGFGNLRFAAGVNIRPHTPFFPVAFHAGKPAVALALEAADIVAEGASVDLTPTESIARLRRVFEQRVRPLQQRMQHVAEREFRFAGIDISPAPGSGPDGSIAQAIEKMGTGQFGDPGTLASAALVTAALQTADITKCGYCGLMLPVLEDAGLAKRNNQGKLRLSQLLSYSAVCGTGLDTIPLAGDVSEQQIVGILSDVGALGWKLQKPLSARLLPIPGKRVGEMTAFDFPFFVNTKVMAVE